ncbi:MAG TPA: hypothetical protein VGM20_08580 [Gemmatimonadales bacterium]|jgi:hypothetical protein
MAEVIGDSGWAAEQRRRRLAERPEHERLEALNNVNPAAVCAIEGHEWISPTESSEPFCKHCGAPRPA